MFFKLISFAWRKYIISSSIFCLIIYSGILFLILLYVTLKSRPTSYSFPTLIVPIYEYSSLTTLFLDQSCHEPVIILTFYSTSAWISVNLAFPLFSLFSLSLFKSLISVSATFIYVDLMGFLTITPNSLFL